MEISTAVPRLYHSYNAAAYGTAPARSALSGQQPQQRHFPDRDNTRVDYLLRGRNDGRSLHSSANQPNLNNIFYGRA